MTGSVLLKCRSFCQKSVVFQDRWSLMAVVSQDRFYYTINCELEIFCTAVHIIGHCIMYIRTSNHCYCHPVPAVVNICDQLQTSHGDKIETHFSLEFSNFTKLYHIFRSGVLTMLLIRVNNI